MNSSDLATLRRSKYGISTPFVDDGFAEMQKTAGTAIAERMAPLGFVDGAWKTAHGHQMPGETIDFAPPGATVSVPAGSLVMVQDAQVGDTWTRFLFVHEGRLRGPLVYAVCSPSADTIREAVLPSNREGRDRLERRLTLALSIIPSLAAVRILMKLLPDLPGIVWHIALAMPVGAIASGFVLTLVPGIMRLRDRFVVWRTISNLRRFNYQMTVPVKLPDEAWRQCSQSALLTAPRIAPETPETDLEISTALGRARQSERSVSTLASRVGRLERSVVRHSLGIIEDISKRAQRGGHLKEGSALKTAIREAIGKAEAEMKRLATEGRDREQEVLMQEIRALRGQMDAYLGAPTPNSR